MRQQQQLNWQQRSIVLGIIWLIGVICDRLWFQLDNSVPAWDQADYLNGVLNYWEALQTPQWFNGEWWRSFWLLSNKIPPLNYILTVPSINLFGTSEDAATTVMLFYSAVLLFSVYGLGVVLFDATVGLWAAGLCQLIPGLYSHRLEFILDYPLTTVITFSYYLLTVYFFCNSRSWLWAILAGISVGLAVLTKQTALFFLFPVILAIFIRFIAQRQWWRLIQLTGGGLSAIAVAFPWYRTNWLLILTSGKRATVDSAIAEGDPALNTLAAWTYYLKLLPQLLTWNLLLIPLAGFIFYVISKLTKKSSHNKFPTNYFARDQWIWLTTYLLGGYLLSSLNINKDPRYILPLLPVLAIILAVGLLLWRSRWRNYILTATASLGIILMLLNIFPLPLIANKLNPQGGHYPYTGEFPHPQVITTIKNTSPYLRLVLGVLPSTPEINQHNFSFYGKQNQGKISGRQVGVREEEILADSRSLDWFLTKTGDNGSIPASQPAMVQLIESGKDFQLKQSWQLPDKTQLKLYHRYFPTVEVAEFNQASNNNQNLSLEKVELPAVSPPGVAIPITYNWVGSPNLLQTGIVLLTWRQTEDPNAFWIHDHALGMGALNFPSALDNQPAFKVIERTAMQTPLDIKPGKYNLEATYLDRNTGKTQNLALPNINITIDPQATATAAPELDLGTQLRNIAPKMAENIKGLEAIFTQTARINQYDAQQDYLPQVEKALSYRLEHNQVNNIQQQVNWLYGVALSQVLQQNVEGAIASFKKITTLDPRNPYGYAYLGFVYLYDWQPKPADIVLNTAIKINPNIAEIKTLKGVASLMQGRFIKAWKMLNNH